MLRKGAEALAVGSVVIQYPEDMPSEARRDVGPRGASVGDDDKAVVAAH